MAKYLFKNAENVEGSRTIYRVGTFGYDHSPSDLDLYGVEVGTAEVAIGLYLGDRLSAAIEGAVFGPVIGRIHFRAKPDEQYIFVDTDEE